MIIIQYLWLRREDITYSVGETASDWDLNAVSNQISIFKASVNYDGGSWGHVRSDGNRKGKEAS